MVSGGFWGFNEPAKVVISLRTSFKNQFFTQAASEASSRDLLKGLQTCWAGKWRPKKAPKPCHKPCSWWSWSCAEPRAGAMALQKQLKTDFVWFLIGFGATFAVLNSNSIILTMARLQKMNTTSWKWNYGLGTPVISAIMTNNGQPGGQ